MTAVEDASLPEAEPVTTCRGCGGTDLPVVLDLGRQPACDHFPPADDPAPDPCWPLALVLCRGCALVQLSHRSPAPEEPLAIESATLQQHAVDVAARIVDRVGLGENASFREFASHHGGSWATALTAHGLHEVSGGADLVLDNQSIIHAEDLEAELAERVAALGADGALVIEFHHALRQLLDAQFDTVRHGHPLYFSLHSWAAACERHGLSVTDAWVEDVFGGCLVVVARRGRHEPSRAVQQILDEERAAHATSPSAYARLADHARRRADDLVDLLRAETAAGRQVGAYGAGSKACTFLGVAGVRPDVLPVVADLAVGKHGRRVPGTGIPIVSPDELVAARPDLIVVLTWDIADEVVAQLGRQGLRDARFVVPLPTLREVRPAPAPQA